MKRIKLFLTVFAFLFLIANVNASVNELSCSAGNEQKVATVTLTSNLKEDTMPYTEVYTPGSGEYLFEREIILTKRYGRSLPNPINLEKGDYTVRIKEGAFSRWKDDNVDIQGQYGFSNEYHWESTANIVYNDARTGELTLYKIGEYLYKTQQEAEDAGKGDSYSFPHDGGNIYLFIDDLPIEDDRGSVTVEVYKIQDNEDCEDDEDEEELSCNQVDFNCDGKVDIEDKAVIVDVFSSRVAYNANIDSQVVAQFVEKYNGCKNLENYLNGLLTRDGLYKGKFTFNDLTSIGDKIDSCQEDEDDEDNDGNGKKKDFRANLLDMCEPNFQCSGWSSCENGVQTRSCVDLNGCEYSYDEEDESRACLVDLKDEQVKLSVKPISANYFWVWLLAIGILIIFVIMVIYLALR